MRNKMHIKNISIALPFRTNIFFYLLEYKKEKKKFRKKENSKFMFSNYAYF